MAASERRRAERHPVDYPGRLFLSANRVVGVRILNLGELGALVAASDLEEAILEGERALLEHPVLLDGEPQDEIAQTVCAVVRVEMDFGEAGIARHLALFFDGGGVP
jgi:hypothetical protein